MAAEGLRVVEMTVPKGEKAIAVKGSAFRMIEPSGGGIVRSISAELQMIFIYCYSGGFAEMRLNSYVPAT